MFGKLSRSFGLLAPHALSSRIAKPSSNSKSSPVRAAPAAAAAGPQTRATDPSEDSEAKLGLTARGSKPIAPP